MQCNSLCFFFRLRTVTAGIINVRISPVGSTANKQKKVSKVKLKYLQQSKWHCRVMEDNRIALSSLRSNNILQYKFIYKSIFILFCARKSYQKEMQEKKKSSPSLSTTTKTIIKLMVRCHIFLFATIKRIQNHLFRLHEIKNWHIKVSTHIHTFTHTPSCTQ